MSSSDFEDIALLEEFVLESRELLDDVEVKLIALERSRSQSGKPDRPTLDAVFRAFHSIKGSAGFLDFTHLVRVTHIAESLLDDIRAERYPLSGEHVTVLCDALDFSRDALDNISTVHSDAALAGRVDGVVERLRGAISESSARAASGAAPPAPPQAAPPAPTPPPRVDLGPEPAPAPARPASAAAPPRILRQDQFTRQDRAPAAVAATPDEPAAPQPAPPAPEVAAPPAQVAAAPVTLAPPAPAPAPSTARTPFVSPAPAPSAAPPRDEASAANSSRRETIRVDVEKLDAFMNLVGELILAENMVTHNEELTGLEIESFQQASLQLNRVTRDLHDIAVAVRMIPIGGVFNKMERLVRDLAQKLDKDIELVIAGAGTEVDKNLIESIADPLVHLMRNAIDHGLEAPEERIAKGKPAKGTIRLDARHHGGEVWISVSEDGRGLDRDRIQAKAVERGLIDAGGAASWPDSAIFQLIFQPGFSTAATVTDVSGRGVGLDVVRRNITALKGRVEIASELGRGTTFTLRIPLTLAIIEGMLVQVGAAQYTIPLLSIRESIQIGKDTVRALPDGRELADVRGSYIPIVRLANLHGLESTSEPASGILVIIEHEGKVAALHVDSLLGQRQTVIKPLPDYIGDHATISGCSILSNGQISLILNLAGLTQHIRAVRGVGAHDAAA